RAWEVDPEHVGLTRHEVDDVGPHPGVEGEAVQEHEGRPVPLAQLSDSEQTVAQHQYSPSSVRPSGPASSSSSPVVSSPDQVVGSGPCSGSTCATISSSTRRTDGSPTHRCLAPSTPITVACGTRAKR